MKRIRLVTILLLCCFLLTTNKDSFGDIVSELSAWMSKIDNLSRKIDDMERDIDSIKDSFETFKEKEKLLEGFSSRIKALEQMESGETMDTLKKGLSELRKTVEDQQVVTSVLEKKYQQAQRPLKPLKAAIEEQKALVAKLIARIEAQDKTLQSFSDTIEKKVKPLDELTKKLDEKMASIGKLTEIISSVQKDGGGIDSKLIVGLLGATDTKGTGTVAKDTSSSKDEKKEFSIKDILTAQGFKDIGGDFFVKDIKFKSFGSSVEVSGVVMNNSKKDYNIANLRIFVYDKRDSLMRSQDFYVKGIRKGNVGSFKEIISGVRIYDVKKYAIAFGKTTRSYQITNLIPIAGEKESSLAASKDDVKEGETSPKLEEGFIEAGNDFYVRNLNIKKFGSSCEITGEVRHLSDKYFSLTRFNIRIFSGRKQLIWEQDFSVRGINGGKIKKFSEFLTGIKPEDVSSFEIKYKR
ncbi:MAG: coiled-coil domain-containing protein [Candidatus Anammoxibacter sp.]